MFIEFNLSLLEQPVEAWAAWYFDRPILDDLPNNPSFQNESEAIDRSDWGRAEDILTGLAELHERYAEWGRRYSAAQLDQGLWGMFCDPQFLGELFFNDELSFQRRVRGVRSLVVPYRDYVQVFDAQKQMPHGWYMLWDLILGHVKPSRDIADVILDCLREILALPDQRCQSAALHGLNHLDHPDRPTVVERWAKKYGGGWNREWLENCRDGTAM